MEKCQVPDEICFVQLGFSMKLTHLSPVQYLFIISKSKVFIRKSWRKAILIKTVDNKESKLK